MKDKFNFFIPLDIEKGSEGQLVKIKGVCSSDAEDSDGETLIPAGFDFAPLLKSGFLNWNHQARTTSKAICGEPTSASIINGGKDFYIEGLLYPNAEGKSVVELAETLEKHSPNRRLGFSIEGQAIERDVLNPKKVLRATITGVAITQSPKNPNTLMSIVKGEYADEFISEEVEQENITAIEPKLVKLTVMCVESSVEQIKEQLLNLNATVESEEQLDKAMTANVDLNPPSIEGANKTDVFVNLLKKSDIYNQISKRYTNDFEKAEKIYQFINQVKEKHMVTDNITPDVLEKAFSLLDQSILEKGGEEQKSPADYDKKDEITDNDDDGGNKEVEKSEESASSNDGDDDDDDDDFEKAMNAESFAKSLFDKGMSEGDIVKAMTSCGVTLALAETACANCIAQANAEKDGGNITALAKSEDGDNKTDELIKSFGESIDRKFSALGIILKSANETNATLAKKVDELEKSKGELSKQIEQLQTQPNERRAVTNVKALERFEKSADGKTTIENYDSKNPTDMKALGNRLFKEIELLKSQGVEDRGLEKAVADLEIAKSTNFQAISPRLRALNINVH